MIRQLLRKTKFGRQVFIPFFRKLIHEILHETVGADIRFHQQWKAAEQTVDYIEKHFQNAREADTRYELFDYALEQASLDGLYLEFGIYKGDSINYIASKISKTIHGFDSFDGLPEYWMLNYDKGTLAVNKGKLKFNENVELHVGLFDDTLPEFAKNINGNIAFLHIDPDLYSSTVTIFKCLSDYIKTGTIIVFDEYFNYPGWQNGEFKAFQEYCAETGSKYEYIRYNRFSGQVAARIL